MLYLYRRAASEGLRELARLCDGLRYRAINVPLERKVRPGDRVVCWGEAFSAPAVTVLNGAPIRSKFTDAQTLAHAGVPTVQVRQTPPPPVPVGPDPALMVFEAAREQAADLVGINFVENGVVPRTGPLVAGVTQLTATLQAFLRALQTPPPAPRIDGEWLPRTNTHMGGQDLLTPPGRPDFYSKKENLVREYRIHSFRGKSIRAGIKEARPDYVGTRHPWIRSFDAGWRIRYDGFTARQAQRDLAHATCRALGLDFAAVDIGEKEDGSLIVLEANRAPGIEGGTLEAYARHIEAWSDGQ